MQWEGFKKQASPKENNIILDLMNQKELGGEFIFERAFEGPQNFKIILSISSHFQLLPRPSDLYKNQNMKSRN